MSAGELAEGPNTIRVCVADAAGNAGSETTSVVKDTTAPTVTVDAVSDALLGPSDTGTDVTWHADEDGTYSVRVGGEDCTTGDEVESGGYTGAPAQHTTTVSAGQLAEGANTIRVCVTDAAGNEGSETTSVVKDTTAPSRDGRLGLRHPDRLLRHGHRRHLARGRGRRLQRAGRRSGMAGLETIACTTGTTVASGSYTGAPAPSTTTVNASALRETLNPIRVCVTDAAGNLGSQTIYVVKDLVAPAVTVDSVSDP